MHRVDLLANLDVRSVRGRTARTIARVTDRDDAVTGADTCFVAVRGARVDGHDRIPAHAACAVVEREVEVGPDTTLVRVEDTRTALAALALRRLGLHDEVRETRAEARRIVRRPRYAESGGDVFEVPGQRARRPVELGQRAVGREDALAAGQGLLHQARCGQV